MPSPTEFLEVLWGTEEKGVAELAVMKPDRAFAAWPFEWPDCGPNIILDAAKRHNQTSHVYVGICLRRERWPRLTGRTTFDGKPEQAKRGTEDNILLANAIWAEFDFVDDAKEGHKGRVIEASRVREMLHEFCFKPSIIVKSGGGIQVYWLTKEPITGDDLLRLKVVNRRLITYFTEKRADGKEYGADSQAFDLARCFRLPGTVNHKYKPPRQCEICYWKPDHRYILDDFEEILPEVPDVKPASHRSFRTGSGPAAGAVRPIPSIELPEENIQKIIKLLNELWIPGHRHKMALQIAGWFAFAGVKFESTQACIIGVSEANGGDTADRVKCVETTYTNFLSGAEVQGRPALEKTIEADLPEIAKKGAKDILEKIQKLLPKPPKNRERGGNDGNEGNSGGKGSSQPDFEIVRIRKFDSRPARYVVTIRKHDEQEDHDVPCEIEIFSNFKKFRTAYLEVTRNKFLAPIKQHVWEAMISQAPLDVVPAPQEATVAGAIRTKLEAFLDEKKENPELGDLKTFPGYNENEIFFHLDAFRRRLREAGIKASDREITQVLKDDGWKDDRRWIGGKNPRIWVRAIAKGGSTNGNGSLDHEPQSNLFGPPREPGIEG